MTDIEVVRALTGNTEISDDLIAFYLESTTQFILSYCNIKCLPDGLKPTFLEITAYRVKSSTNGAAADLGAGIKQVGSVSDGNQSVSYVAGSTGGKSFIGFEDVISAYGSILDRYRCMVVDGPHCRHLGARRLRW